MENTQQDIDYQWFTENYAELSAKYRGRFVVIKDKTVVADAATYAEGVRLGQEKGPLGTFIVQYCDGTKELYTNYIASMNFV